MITTTVTQPLIVKPLIHDFVMNKHFDVTLLQHEEATRKQAKLDKAWADFLKGLK